MHIAVLLPHATPRPAAIKGGVAAPVVGVARQAEHAYPVTSRLDERIDVIDGPIVVGRRARRPMLGSMSLFSAGSRMTRYGLAAACR
jgi:hypothetical protein